MTMLKKGTADVVRYFMMRKVSDGAAFTGATITTFDLQYTRELTASATKIDAIVGTGGATTHVDNKVFEIDSTSSPGLYMVCFPDAAFAAGVDQVTLNLKYDATVFAEAQNIQMVDFDPFDAVRMGMTAIPDADADAAGGLPISDAGGFDVDNRAISAAATVNMEDMYDGTGYTAETAPASRAQVDGIGAASGGAFPIEVTEDNATVAIKGVSKVGTEAGTFANTEADDASYHVLTHAANDIDWIYGFNVGGARTGVKVRFKGYLNSNNDDMLLQAYDFVGTDWETIKQIPGQNGAADIELNADILLKHTGTGADLGKVYIRLQADGVMTSPVMNVNLLLVDAINIGTSVGYALGRVWLNTVSGVAGTEPYTNGVADQAVDLIASAKTLATAVGLADFHIINGSQVDLAEDSSNESYFGDNWTLGLGGQICADLYVQGASVSGIGTAATGHMHFEGCDFGTASVQSIHADFCSFDSTVTHTLAGDYKYHNCYSGVAGASGPIFTKTPGQAITAQWRNWADSIAVSNIEAGDVMTINGRLGTVTLNGVDGTVEIRGPYKQIIDNRTGGSVVLNTDGAWKGSDIEDILDDTGTSGVLLAATATSPQLIADIFNEVLSKGTYNTGQSLGKIIREIGTWAAAEGVVSGTPTTTSVTTNITGFDDNFFRDQNLFAYNGAAQAGQGRIVTTYNGTTGVFTFDEAFTTALIAGDDVIATSAHVHAISQIQSGLATEAKQDTAQAAIDAIDAIVDLLLTDTTALLIDTGEIGTAGAGLTDLGGMSTAMKAELLTEVVKVLTTQMTESYAADGVEPTLAQSLFMVQQMLTEFAISGTVFSVKGLDGTTVKATFTLDDNTNPTSMTRAT